MFYSHYQMKKLKTILFGITGFGNNAFQALIKHPDIELLGVFTPQRLETPFPYYPCEKLHDLVTKHNVKLFEGYKLRNHNTVQIISNFKPDLIMIGSFYQIIPLGIIRIPPIGVINLHPSLLPKYRGATPVTWALINEEKETGMTAHFVEDEGIDRGRIIIQIKLKIEHEDNDGILRMKLAKLSETIINKTIENITKTPKENFPTQDEAEASYYPKRTSADGEIKKDLTFRQINNKIKAMTPYPGAFIILNNIRYKVVGATLINQTEPVSRYLNKNEIIIDSLDKKVKLSVIYPS